MIVSIGTSRLGLKPTEIFSIDGYTPLELYNALKDFDDRNNAHYRSRWEVMRSQVVSIYNMRQTKKKKQIKNPQSIMRFPWEENYYNKKEQTIEEQKNVLGLIFGSPKKRKELNDGR